MLTHSIFQEVKAAAVGRWVKIIAAASGCDAELLNSKRQHPCPACGGKTRFRFTDKAGSGSSVCTKCDNTSDGIGTLARILGDESGNGQHQAALLAAHQLGIETNGKSKPRPQTDPIGEYAKQKNTSTEALQDFGATTSGNALSIPMFDAQGAKCGAYNVELCRGNSPTEKYATGGKHGLFLPLSDGSDGPRTPQPGETWFLVEGVKDASKLHSMGYLAAGMPTCNLSTQLATTFRGVDVVSIPDLDDAATNGLSKTAANLRGVAASYHVIRLPMEYRESKGLDVRDAVLKIGEQATRAFIDDQQNRQTAADYIDAVSPTETVEVDDETTSFDLLKPQHRTETALAARYIRDFGESIRYVGTWNKWIVWDGTRWKLDDMKRVEALAQATVATIWVEVGIAAQEVSAKGLRSLVAYASGCNRHRVITDALKICEPQVACTHNALDADPWSLNVKNGIVDLSNGTLRPHDPKAMHTKLAPVNFDPGANCPHWLRFFDEIFGGDEGLKTYIQSLVGYTLIGNTSENILAILFGNGANGKSTMLETLMDVMGDYALKAKAEILLVRSREPHPTELADLHGCRLVAMVEPDATKKLAETVVKELTGGDTIRARRMREDLWQFKPTHTIWLACNNRPSVHGTDDGIWRRLKLIPFNRQWDTDGTRKDLPPADKQLTQKLTGEHDGIFMWALAGLRRYLTDGINVPSSVAAASKAYRDASDLVGQFIESECVVSPQAWVKPRALFVAFSAFCIKANQGPWTETRFGEEIEKRFPKRKTKGVLRRDGIGLGQGGVAPSV
ncbi:MAG: phage/plasmid primase, P4 family [Fuerstiella sp.]